jgi:hypothetical protein
MNTVAEGNKSFPEAGGRPLSGPAAQAAQTVRMYANVRDEIGEGDHD